MPSQHIANRTFFPHRVPQDDIPLRVPASCQTIALSLHLAAAILMGTNASGRWSIIEEPDKTVAGKEWITGPSARN